MVEFSKGRLILQVIPPTFLVIESDHYSTVQYSTVQYNTV